MVRIVCSFDALTFRYCDCGIQGALGKTFLLLLRLLGFPSSCLPTTFLMLNYFEVLSYCCLPVISWSALFRVNLVQSVEVLHPFASSEAAHLFDFFFILVRKVSIL
jgi:hypothetical protein